MGLTSGSRAVVIKACNQMTGVGKSDLFVKIEFNSN